MNRHITQESGLTGPSDKMTKYKIHHGLRVKQYLKDINMSVLQFEKRINKSHGWVYSLFNSETLGLDKIALLILVLDLPIDFFGDSIPEDLFKKRKDRFKNVDSYSNNTVFESCSDTISKLTETLKMYGELINHQTTLIEKQEREIRELKKRNIVSN